MPEIVQICGGLYDVDGCLAQFDDSLFDLSKENDRECLAVVAALMETDEAMSVFGSNTVIWLSTGCDSEIIPAPVHVEELGKGMAGMVRRYRREGP